MTKPAKRDARDQVVRVARAILKDEGMSGFSSRKVASRAGVSLGTLSYHFPKLDYLVDEILEPLHDAFAHVIADAMQAPEDEHLLDTVARTIVDLYRRLLPLRPLAQLRMSRNITTGSMSDFHGRNTVFPAFEMVQTFLAGRCDLVQLRLLLHSLAILTMRYVIHPPEEQQALTALAGRARFGVERGAHDPRPFIEKHLALVARNSLGAILTKC